MAHLFSKECSFAPSRLEGRNPIPRFAVKKWGPFSRSSVLSSVSGCFGSERARSASSSPSSSRWGRRASASPPCSARRDSAPKAARWRPQRRRPNPRGRAAARKKRQRRSPKRSPTAAVNGNPVPMPCRLRPSPPLPWLLNFPSFSRRPPLCRYPHRRPISSRSLGLRIPVRPPNRVLLSTIARLRQLERPPRPFHSPLRREALL